MPFAPSSFLFLVAMLGAPSSIVAPTLPTHQRCILVLWDL